MRIEHLKDHKNLIPQLAAWHHAQWSYLNPGDSVEKRIVRLGEHVESGGVPATFVALSDDGMLLGSASIVAHDMDSRMELTPWLASVFVAVEHRRRGIAASLIKHVVGQAAAMRHGILYLFTTDQAVYYAKHGWTSIERTEYRGADVEVMSIRTT